MRRELPETLRTTFERCGEDHERRLHGGGKHGRTTVPGTVSPPSATHPDSETTRSRILAIVPTLFLAKCEFAVNIRETMSI